MENLNKLKDMGFLRVDILFGVGDGVVVFVSSKHFSSGGGLLTATASTVDGALSAMITKLEVGK